jgi:hypothetical protein
MSKATQGGPFRMSPELYKWPATVDSLPPVPGEPAGYHARRRTETGYPLMGSSDAERDANAARSARARAACMRDHPFEGDGQYCQHWRVLTDRMTMTGRLVMRDQCGWARDMHPEAS